MQRQQVAEKSEAQRAPALLIPMDKLPSEKRVGYVSTTLRVASQVVDKSEKLTPGFNFLNFFSFFKAIPILAAVVCAIEIVFVIIRAVGSQEDSWLKKTSKILTSLIGFGGIISLLIVGLAGPITLASAVLDCIYRIVDFCISAYKKEPLKELAQKFHDINIAFLSLAGAILFFLDPVGIVGISIIAATTVYGILDWLELNPFKWAAKKIFGDPFAERENQELSTQVVEKPELQPNNNPWKKFATMAPASGVQKETKDNVDCSQPLKNAKHKIVALTPANQPHEEENWTVVVRRRFR